MIEAVLFDLDGTLVDYIDSDCRCIRMVHSQAGTSVDFQNFYKTSVEKLFNFYDLADNRQIDPLLMNSYRLSKTFEHYQIEWNDSYANFYSRNLIDLCTPYEGVIQMLEWLKPRVKLGMITNAADGREQRNRMRNAGIFDFFDYIMVAGDMDVYKPNPLIFTTTLEHLNVTAEHAVFIGDSDWMDVGGAQAAGMRAVWLNKGAENPDCEADYSVQDIAELTNLLKDLLDGKNQD